MCWLFFSAKTKDACFCLSNGVESFEAEDMRGNFIKFKGIFNNSIVLLTNVFFMWWPRFDPQTLHILLFLPTELNSR